MSNYAQKYQQKQQSHSGKPEDTKSVISQQSKTTYKSNNTQSKKSEAPSKQEIIENMKQNDDKHKQMMQENMRRRKQKEKELKQIEDKRREQEMKLLEQRKKTKEEAYVKYLRVNSKNVLQQLKGGPVQNQHTQVEIEKPNNNFAALDIEMVKQANKNFQGYQRKKPIANTSQLRDDFEQKWEQQVQDYKVMRKSELLDSLDLEVSTRPKTRKVPEVDFIYYPYFKKKIEELIGYEDVESENENEDDFWNQTMKNGKLELRNKNFKEIKEVKETPPQKQQMAPQQQQITTQTQQSQQTLHQQQMQSKPLTKENLNEQNMNIQKEELLRHQKEQENNNRKNTQNKTQTTIPTSNLPPKVDQKIVTHIQSTQNRNASVGKQPQKQTIQKKVNLPTSQGVKGQQIRRKSPNTIATREEDIDVQEFLKDDLKNLNQQELELQKQLQLINQENQQKISEVNTKYNLRTNLVSSQQVRRGDKSLQQVPAKKEQTEEEKIEASLMRLDYLLIKKPDSQQQQIPSQQQDTTIYPPFPKMLQQNTQYLQKTIQNEEKQLMDQQQQQKQQFPLENNQARYIQQQPSFSQPPIQTYQQPQQIFNPPPNQYSNYPPNFAQQQQFGGQNPYQQAQNFQNINQQPSLQTYNYNFQPPQQQQYQQIQSLDQQKLPMQDSLDFDNLISNKKEQFIYHQSEPLNIPGQMQQNQYNYDITSQNQNLANEDYLKTLLQERPDIIEKLGYVKADVKDDISRSEQYQQSQVSEVSRDFKISRKKIHRKDSKKLNDTEISQNTAAKGYAQTAAAMKKLQRGHSASRQQQQQTDDFEVEEQQQEGKIRLEGNLRHLLVDDSQ